MKNTIERFKKNWFLFQELVKRDFRKKYKRTVLGMAWSVLSPLLTLLVLKLVFTGFFGRSTEHYTIYLFAGTIVMSYFREGTTNGLGGLVANSSVLTKINVPKYLFVLSRNVSALYNFLLTLALFFVFCIIDHITFSWKMLLLVYPIGCLIILIFGTGLVLSAMEVFFRDTQYLYAVFLTLLNYVSAIFYRVDQISERYQRLFLLNPVYVIIKYFRTIVIDGVVPSLSYHGLCILYPVVLLLIGGVMYKKLNRSFVYYF